MVTVAAMPLVQLLYPVSMVQAWVVHKFENVSFYEVFDVRFDKYLRRLLVKTCNSKQVFQE